MNDDEGRPCGNTAAGGYVCCRERLHPGAHFAESGHWWAQPFEGIAREVFAPLSHSVGTPGIDGVGTPE